MSIAWFVAIPYALIIIILSMAASRAVGRAERALAWRVRCRRPPDQADGDPLDDAERAAWHAITTAGPARDTGRHP